MPHDRRLPRVLLRPWRRSGQPWREPCTCPFGITVPKASTTRQSLLGKSSSCRCTTRVCAQNISTTSKYAVSTKFALTETRVKAKTGATWRRGLGRGAAWVPLCRWRRRAVGGWETRQDARPRGLSPQSPPGSTEADGWAVCTCRALESSGMPQSEGCGGGGALFCRNPGLGGRA